MRHNIWDGERFTPFLTEYNKNVILGTLIDRHDNLWFGTSNGMLKWDGKKVIKFSEETGLPESAVSQIIEDKDSNIWFFVSDKYQNESIWIWDGKKFTIYESFDKEIFNLIQGENGAIWGISHKGLTQIQRKGENLCIEQFSNLDGFKGASFRGLIQDQEKQFWIAANNEIHVSNLQPDTSSPQIFINQLDPFLDFVDWRQMADTVKEAANLSIGDDNISLKDVKYDAVVPFANLPVNPVFPYGINQLTLHWSATYSAPHKLQYSYFLEGSDRAWSPLVKENSATYTNLSAGNYTFKVRAVNGNGRWSDTATYTFSILPPWWATWWAYTLYGLFTLGIIVAFYRFQLNRRLAQAEAKRLRELDQVKTSLYTNITHEFRTPLTIILGMADKVEQAPRQWLQEGIQMIRRNGQSLLRLVNQMLDLSKLEAGSLPVNMVQGDIIAYLHRLLELFRSYADSKNIKLEFASEQEQFVMDYDADKVKDIISNLMSNALKFTPEGGEIKLEVGSGKSEGIEHIHITVKDSGVGIPAEKLPHIFDRFYQADDSATRKGEGTGIGLALTKELVRLLGGTIEVESKLGKGSVFQVQLPVRNTAPLLETTPEVEPAMTASATPEPMTAKKGIASLPQMLIVEDNADVISYLRSCLQAQYRIEVAYNGQEGIDKAIELVPDVIISDVMMPEKDGFELCRTLKDDMRTSHIPIVLLTARADMDSRLEGLEGGADAYLTKPFNEQELEVSLRKSLELRQRLRERYTRDIPISPDDSFSRDDAFITKLHRVLEAHYSDEDFNIPALATAMDLSHAQLGRKLHALLDTTPQLYLRHYRLQKAYYLLKYSDLSVKEVAFATGFSDPGYLSKAFSEEFQQNPRDLRK